MSEPIPLTSRQTRALDRIARCHDTHPQRGHAA